MLIDDDDSNGNENNIDFIVRSLCLGTVLWGLISTEEKFWCFGFQYDIPTWCSPSVLGSPVNSTNTTLHTQALDKRIEIKGSSFKKTQ